jgi:hypothetical protein
MALKMELEAMNQRMHPLQASKGVELHSIFP